MSERCWVSDVSQGGTRGVHESIFVCDVAIMRSSFGFNPLLAITVLAGGR